MIDVSELLYDPDFSVCFNIIRKELGKWAGGRASAMQKKIAVTGIVTAVNSKDLEMLAEGDRVHGLKTFYADKELRVTGNEATADICEYQGKRYRLIQLFDYSNNGFYKAIGTLIGGVG